MGQVPRERQGGCRGCVCGGGGVLSQGDSFAAGVGDVKRKALTRGLLLAFGRISTYLQVGSKPDLSLSPSLSLSFSIFSQTLSGTYKHNPVLTNTRSEAWI